MQAAQQGSTSYPVLFLLVDETDHVTPVTGASPTLTISKNGGAFGACSGSAVEVGGGIYKLANATDFDTLGPCVLKASALGCDPSVTVFRVSKGDPFKVHAMIWNRVQALLANV